MADELNTGVEQTAPATPAEPTTSTSTAAPAVSAATSTPSSAETPAQQTAPQTPAYESARDFANKVLGWKAEYADDESFLRATYAESQTLRRQLEEARQLAQQYAYLQQQQAKPAPTADKPDPLARYKAPEFNPAWLQMVTKDAEGNWRPLPGVDPAVIPKLHAYQAHQAEVAQQLTRDPVGYLKDMIEHVASEKARSLLQEQMSVMQGDQYVNNFLKENANWLLQKDSQGRFLTNPATGQAMLTPEGGRLYYYMKEAEDGGIKNPLMQERYAMYALRAELSQPAAQGAAAVAQGEQQKQALLQQMNRGNRSGSMTPPENGGPAVQNPSLSLKERLMALPDAAFQALAS